MVKWPPSWFPVIFPLLKLMGVFADFRKDHKRGLEPETSGELLIHKKKKKNINSRKK